MLEKILFCGESGYALHELVVGDSGERILDPGFESHGIFFGESIGVAGRTAEGVSSCWSGFEVTVCAGCGRLWLKSGS